MSCDLIKRGWVKPYYVPRESGTIHFSENRRNPSRAPGKLSESLMKPRPRRVISRAFHQPTRQPTQQPQPQHPPPPLTNMPRLPIDPSDSDSDNLLTESRQKVQRAWQGFVDFAFQGNVLEIAFGLMYFTTPTSPCPPHLSPSSPSKKTERRSRRKTHLQ